MIEPITKQEARARKLWQMTNGIWPNAEKDMLEGILADLRKRKIDHAVVKCSTGLQVWRGGEKAGHDADKAREQRTEEPAWTK